MLSKGEDMNEKGALFLFISEIVSSVSEEDLLLALARSSELKENILDAVKKTANNERHAKDFEKYKKSDPTGFPFNVGC